MMLLYNYFIEMVFYQIGQTRDFINDAFVGKQQIEDNYHAAPNNHNLNRAILKYIPNHKHTHI